ncbi:PIN domain-containing protein [Breznakiellaceae bacterium SP9]
MNFLNRRIIALPKGLLYISRITRMELPAKPEYKDNKEAERTALDFIAGITAVGLSDEIENRTVEIRRNKPAIKLPDAIVAASACVLGIRLVSCDGRLIAQLAHAAPELSAVYEQPLV